MIDALGIPQSLLVLGGTSDIGLAIARHWAQQRPLRVTLAGRDPGRLEQAAAQLRPLGATVETMTFDARRTASHPDEIGRVFAAADVDVAVVAFGLLGDPEAAWQDVATAVEMAQVNYMGAVSAGVCLAKAMTTQGHGVIVALSSVAGERMRRSNFVYGSTKAGMDGFYLGLGEALAGSGVHVLVARPGFVTTKMTRDLPTPPMAVTPARVAKDVARAVARRTDQIWVPAPLRYAMSGLRHLPRPLFRRLPI